ncbi:hypothetical protein GCM10009555_010300 [Acrocarpospora macrocephala]|uniref:Serine/threonine protein kinase n=1 Tax=Acrocarpospora macrocephala TaxID=150177 RepID=A0A5M3WVH9_9ACTN|nr:hypothetical protein [Acrocarpospora macrocephala]GES10563.1 hypothetical protein Amac_041600 [Acrocarpospora macrocephala]
MATPLQYGDPPRLGPFVLQARLQAAPAGLVYLGQGADGRAVSVAVLTRGAALDPAARNRFVTGIKEGEAARSGVRGLFSRVSRRRNVTTPPVVAWDGGEAPWVAVPYAPGGVGAERFLEPVMVSGMLIGDRHGPDFVPYWLGDRNPALPAPPPPAPPRTETVRSVALASALLATLVLFIGAILWLMLVRSDDEPMPARPLPPTVFVPTPPPVPTSPEPMQPSPTPGETEQGQSPSPAPGENEDPGQDI